MRIKLNTFLDVKEFVSICSNVPGEITLKQNKYVVDGKSIMGIFSLDLSNELELLVDNSYEENFEKFIV